LGRRLFFIFPSPSRHPLGSDQAFSGTGFLRGRLGPFDNLPLFSDHRDVTRRTTVPESTKTFFAGVRPGGLLVCLIFLIVALPVAAMPFLPTDPNGEDIVLSPRERANVVHGVVIVREIPNPGKAGKTFEAVGTLPGTLDEALAVITDFRHYAEFMPHIKRAVVKDESGHACVVDIQIGLPLGLSRQYRLRFESRWSEGEFLVFWQKAPWPELPPGQTIKDTSGRWLVRKFDGGGLLASYLAYTDPSPVPLGLMGVANAFGKGGMKDVIESVRHRIWTVFSAEGNKRRGQNSCP
jgi:hypothetical protein